MQIKLNLPADVAGEDDGPLTRDELARAAAAAVNRQEKESTKGIVEFYQGWGKVAARLAALTGHGLLVNFVAGPGGATAYVWPAEGNAAGPAEVMTLALEELGVDAEAAGEPRALSTGLARKFDVEGAGCLLLCAGCLLLCAAGAEP